MFLPVEIRYIRASRRARVLGSSLHSYRVALRRVQAMRDVPWLEQEQARAALWNVKKNGNGRCQIFPGSDGDIVLVGMLLRSSRYELPP